MALKLNRDTVENLAQEKKIKTHTLLLVDDEGANLEGLASILEADYNILKAYDGANALEVIKSLPPTEQIHLIISDQRMPNMTGVELFEQLIQLTPNSIRMILSGYADINVILDSINRGSVYKFLSKPVDPNDIQVTVRRALEAFELSRKGRALLSKYKEQASKIQELESSNLKLKHQINVIDKNIIMMMTNKEGRIVYSSDAFCAVAGYNKEELHQQYHNIFHHSSQAVIYHELWQTIKSGKIWQGELLNVTKTGDSYWLRMIAAPIFDSNKQIVGFSFTSENITDKKHI
jgi:PAS domain S-box-containing protein